MFETVVSLLNEHFPENMRVSNVTSDTRFQDDLNMASIDMLALAAATENAIGHPIMDDDTPDGVFVTVGSFVRHLETIRISDRTN